MAERAAERMGVDDFLTWADGQEQRYELVDGVPYMMARAKRGHDRIVANAIIAIGGQLTGRPCEVFTADTAVIIPNGNVRLPDVGVDCGAARDDDRHAVDPRLVIEVLSPSTRVFDLFRKLEEYKSLPSLQWILLIDPDEPQATLWSRDAGARWSDVTREGLDAVLRIPDLELTLPLATLYDRVTFQPKPRLVS